MRRRLPNEAMLEGASGARGSWVVDIWSAFNLDGID
jgi:hypothetical protein